MSARTDRVQAVARRYVEMGAYPSIEWLVRIDGQEWFRGSVGQADPVNGVAVPDKAIYRLYSMTKPVIASIAMMLIEEGKLRLYDAVASYLPDFASMDIIDPDGALRPAKRVMLLEHLLTHRSGLTYGFLPGCAAAKRYREAKLGISAPPLKEMIDTIASLPLAFEPGSEWRYSVATDVVARIIEIVEGKPLQDIVADRILKPLNLSDTGFTVPEDKRDRLVPVFGREDLDGLMNFPDGPQQLTPVDVSPHYPVDDANFARGGYGLYSTADDYAQIGEFLMSGVSQSGDTLLSRHMVDMMWTNRIPARQMPLSIGPIPLPGYGFTLAGRVMADPMNAMGLTGPKECGWSGAAGTFHWNDPDEKMVGVVMTQYLGSRYPLADEMRTAVYQALP
ncbi:MAG: serine hydrolase [Rhizobiaceae bacterium MnEN-MB40S]|nr:MAG: serine hydrolase [Rhizobiaceae bacterium MnEN-MB40S]